MINNICQECQIVLPLHSKYIPLILRLHNKMTRLLKTSLESDSNGVPFELDLSHIG